MQPPTTPPTPHAPYELKPLPPEEWPNIDHIETSDGAPVDSIFSEKQMRLLTEALHSSWRPGRPFVALANVGLFYGVNIPPIVPDMLLSVDVRLPEDLFPKINQSYFVWAYGKPPEVAIEIVSNRKGGEDTDKLRIYANVRVSHYVIYDPDLFLKKKAFRLYRLDGEKYTLDESGEMKLEELGLGLTIWNGRFEDTNSKWLRWTDLDGTLIPTGAERAAIEQSRAEEQIKRAKKEAKRADAESRRAEAESRRAEAESKRAEAESRRAEAESRRADMAVANVVLQNSENDRLRELLRTQGIDPDRLSQ